MTNGIVITYFNFNTVYRHHKPFSKLKKKKPVFSNYFYRMGKT